MSRKGKELRPGDRVEVRSPAEILATLDADGTLDGLPFMPEMVRFCGQRFSVFRRVEKTCVEGYPGMFRRFEKNDVVLLDELRCSGRNHDGCDRGCTLFWKEAWLREATDEDELQQEVAEGCDGLRARLKTTLGPGRYFCQSTQLCDATLPLSRLGRLRVCLRDVRVGNRGLLDMTALLLKQAWRRRRRGAADRSLQGDKDRTPSGSLDLQPGELVEIKSFPEIRATLDRRARNRGMVFTLPMRRFCGQRFRVRSRMDRRIAEDSGEMYSLRDTVTLEGVNCQCYYQLGGCPRADMIYWREIWLRRVEPGDKGDARE